jgi:deoxyribonuclease-4
MFGSHLSIAGGMHNALLEAEKLKLQCVQVFTKNQQQWAAKPLEQESIRAFRGHAERLGFEKIVSHASYLINLAAVDAGMWEKSVAAFEVEMQRCDQLGIAYLVVHPGAHCGSGEACGMEKVVAGINRILEKNPEGNVTVCLETTAGQGSCLGRRFEEIAEMMRGIKRAERIGVCVDTCHILAAGYDITTVDATHAALAEMDRVIGLKNVKVWHLNDSKKALGTRVDRHEHIGRGCVGLPAFEVICRDPRFADVPKILETPKEKAPDGRPWDEVNLELLRAMAVGKAARLANFEAGAKKKRPSRPKKPAAKAKARTR